MSQVTQFPAQMVQGADSTTYHSSDDDYDEVFDATSECNSSGSETGSVFERRMGAIRDRYSKSDPKSSSIDSRQFNAADELTLRNGKSSTVRRIAICSRFNCSPRN